MIKFPCSECNQAIGVEPQYAGRSIRCPGCQQPTKVPAAEEITKAEIVAAEIVEDAPAGQGVNPNLFPHCPSCNSPLSNPSDIVCGICGHFFDQAPAAGTPTRPPTTARPPREDAIVTPVATTVAGLPVNPAIDAKGYAEQPLQGHFANDVTYDDTKAQGRSSVGGWVSAFVAGLFMASIWGVIAAFTGFIGQAFAIAVGASVGLIAGLIARNRSLKFCLASSAAALLCMLVGRLVSAWVVMMAVSSLGVFQDLGSYLIPDTGVTVGVAEEMCQAGEFEGDEKKLAEMKVEAFFSNKTVDQIDGYDDIDVEVEIDVDRKIRSKVGKMADEQRKATLQRVRNDHPDWLEQAWHLEAIIDHMLKQDQIEDEGLRAHAEAKIADLDGAYDEKYYIETAASDQETRAMELDKIATATYTKMNPEERQQAIKQARADHPAWIPQRDHYLAMLSKMYDEDHISEEYRELAKTTIKFELDYDFIETEPLDDYEQEFALQKIVNKELLKLDRGEIEALIVAAQKKHPYWQPETDQGAILGLNSGLDGIIAGFESDGTFWSSLKTRFKPLDFLWLSLGTLSAFLITRQLGIKEDEQEAAPTPATV